MAEPFLGEIRIMSFNFPPKGWALSNGQLLPINQNQALFSLLGTTYGGNGTTTFALPNLQGRVPLHNGSGHTLGERGGESAHTVTQSEMPTHTHVYNASSASDRTTPNPNTTDPTNAEFADTQAKIYHVADGNMVSLGPSTISASGGSQPHENMQPYLTLSFCIALQGIFPSQT
jgi:microcystin-dependent protein